jgi:hypothetical protein
VRGRSRFSCVENFSCVKKAPARGIHLRFQARISWIRDALREYKIPDVFAITRASLLAWQILIWSSPQDFAVARNSLFADYYAGECLTNERRADRLSIDAGSLRPGGELQ